MAAFAHPDGSGERRYRDFGLDRPAKARLEQRWLYPWFNRQSNK